MTAPPFSRVLGNRFGDRFWALVQGGTYGDVIEWTPDGRALLVKEPGESLDSIFMDKMSGWRRCFVFEAPHINVPPNTQPRARLWIHEYHTRGSTDEEVASFKRRVSRKKKGVGTEEKVLVYVEGDIATEEIAVGEKEEAVVGEKAVETEIAIVEYNDLAEGETMRDRRDSGYAEDCNLPTDAKHVSPDAHPSRPSTPALFGPEHQGGPEPLHPHTINHHHSALTNLAYGSSACPTLSLTLPLSSHSSSSSLTDIIAQEIRATYAEFCARSDDVPSIMFDVWGREEEEEDELHATLFRDSWVRNGCWGSAEMEFEF
ncbi:hypothetical protein MNV49_002322 [Pseudohyphozyma bogoriensis]|nr:hypothetical protein MNV49_002322 [Pseudohyphozyma bogoriensis]